MHSKKRKKTQFYLTCFLIFVLGSAVFSEDIEFSGDKMTGNVGTGREFTRLEGKAFVKTSSIEIHADSIELQGTDYIQIIAEGSIQGTHTEGGFTFSCDKVRYNRVSKVAILEGKVRLKETKNDVSIEAQLIEYNQKTDIAVLQIGIKLVSKENICTSAFALYRRKSSILEMSGNPQIVRNKDVFRAQEIIINIDTEDITLDGRVKGSVIDTKKTSVEPPPVGDNKTAGTTEETDTQTKQPQSNKKEGTMP